MRPAPTAPEVPKVCVLAEQCVAFSEFLADVGRNPQTADVLHQCAVTCRDTPICRLNPATECRDAFV